MIPTIKSPKFPVKLETITDANTGLKFFRFSWFDGSSAYREMKCADNIVYDERENLILVYPVREGQKIAAEEYRLQLEKKLNP